MTKAALKRYSDYIIAKDRAVRMLSSLALVLQAAKIEYYAVFPVSARSPEQKEYIRQLEIQQSIIMVEMDELEKSFSLGAFANRTWWDSVKIRIHEWVVYNR